ncbi:MAG: hypothetical protein RJA07_1138 [Bacteroidota bacterium]|jgi:hypothetical protein
MNIYDFIYCYSYFFNEKRKRDAIFNGVFMVFAVAFTQFMLTVVLFDFLKIDFLKIDLSGNKRYIGMGVLGLIIVFIRYVLYSEKRRTIILKKYTDVYTNDTNNTIRVIIYGVLPLALLILMIVVKQYTLINP